MFRTSNEPNLGQVRGSQTLPEPNPRSGSGFGFFWQKTEPNPTSATLLPAHIVDGFRIHCRHNNLEEWAKEATIEEFNRVAKVVYDKLFSTATVDQHRAKEDGDRDVTLENAILYNRDTLFYIEFVQAIKKGDIGRVLNVLSIWMVMMRTPKTMPRYADAI
ncbi:hypothetical protein B0H13DRAFT_2530133 [Mycena leptocephala]|nr:hypothetical protein B0H13DRAFT_2530133 [Mycena leptocephala]